MAAVDDTPKVERDRSPVKDKEGGEQNGSRARDNRPRRDARDSRGDRRPRDNGQPRRSTGDRRQRPERRVYVSNIPFEFQWQELKDLFRNEVGDVSFVEVFHDEKGSSRGCGIIEFASPELIDKALEKMHRYELKGRKIVVKEDFGVERDRHGRILREGRGDGPPGGRDRGPDSRRGGYGGPDSRRGGYGGGHMAGGYRGDDDRGRMGPPVPPEAKYANTYGLNVSFLESLGIEGPLVNRVFVANLDYSVDEKKLKEVFGLAGKVQSVEINKDHEGNSKGHGVVEFDHPVEAVQAISMLNNQTFMDRRISVRMDRVAERRDREPRLSLPAGLKGIGQGLGSNGTALVDVASKIQEQAQAPPPAAAAAQLAGGLAASLTGAAGTGAGAALGLLGAAPQPALGGALPELGGLSALGAVPGLGQLQAAQLGQLGTGAAGLGGLAGLQGTAAFRGSDTLAAARPPQLDQGLAGRAGLDAGRSSLDSGLGGRGGMDYGMGGRSSLDGGMGGRGSLDGGMGGRGSMDHSLGGRGGVDSRGSMDSGRSGGRSSYGGGGGYGSSMGSGGDSGYNSSSRGSYNSDSIIVSNLDPSYTWQMLRDKFRDVGEVRYADMKGKGVGVVRFHSAGDAQRAVSLMDGARVDGRILDVRSY